MRRLPALPCRALLSVLAALLLQPMGAAAARKPVLAQIDLPHSYYYREQYLPRVTSGPAALAWSPDGSSLVYAMQGSLWRQGLDAEVAEQLTDGPGYDFQPDWSPDGARIVFVRYADDALELQLLELASGRVRPLTTTGAVNVEPRWSPDGKRLAWVSTQGTGHFHVFVGPLTAEGLRGAQLWPERRSTVERYYYSPFDHELSPSWAPDGTELIYVSNPETIYGTGPLWRRGLTADSEPVAVRIEETTWKARPDWSPDGKRVIYSSYLGRQWHQLWITTASGGGDPVPLTYGDFDVTGARWSPDASKIAFLSNETGDLAIRILELPGGRLRTLPITQRRYRRAHSRLTVKTVDADGRPVAARLSVLGADGRAFAPSQAWIHADDGYDRALARFETHYFHSTGSAELDVSPGRLEITATRGLEYRPARREVRVAPGRPAEITLRLEPLDLPPRWARFVSGDVHVHMNYGGTYRNTPAGLAAQAEAEDLDVVWNLIVNKEQRVPDVAYFSGTPDPVSSAQVLVLHAQEFHTGFWGHTGLLGLREHLLIPDYAGYANTGAASLVPTNAQVAGLARAQGGLAGYVHPFDWDPDPATETLTNALPVDAALGRVDYYEVVGFSDHRATAHVWHRLLNCGLRIPAAAGTDAMTNFASLRGPVGVNRVYVRVADAGAEPAARRDAWLAGLKAGHTVATNAPLLGLEVEGREPGDELRLPPGRHRLHYSGFLRSIAPVDRLELIWKGRVVRDIALTGERTGADFEGSLEVEDSGWLLLRAWSERADPLVFDVYPYGTTSPVWVSVGGSPVRSAEDADYFLAWIAGTRRAAAAHAGYNTTAEREAVLAELDAAHAVFEACRAEASGI